MKPIANRTDKARELIDAMGGAKADAGAMVDKPMTLPDETILMLLKSIDNDGLFEKRFAGDITGYNCKGQSEADQQLFNRIATRTDNSEQAIRIYQMSELAKVPKDNYAHRGDRRDLMLINVRKAFDRKIPEISFDIPSNPQRYKLLGSSEMSALPPTEWRIRGIFPAKGLCAIYGASASGKTFLAFDMAANIAMGGTWFDYKVKPTVVVYVGLEGEGGFKARVKAWEFARRQSLPDNFKIVLQPFKLTEPQDMVDLAAAVNDLGPNAVIFIDTLNRAANGADENSSKDMGAILLGAKALQEAVSGLVVLIHHTGKDEGKGLRGHSSLFAALDGAVEVTRKDDVRSWTVAKSKDGQDGGKHGFTLSVVGLGFDEGGEITSCTIERAAVPALTVEQARGEPRGGNMKVAWDIIQALLRAAESVAGDLVGSSGSIAFSDATTAVAAALADKAGAHRWARATDAINALVGKGIYIRREGERLWPVV